MIAVLDAEGVSLPHHIARADEPIPPLGAETATHVDMSGAAPIADMLAHLATFATDELGYALLWIELTASIGCDLQVHVDRDGARHLRVGVRDDAQIRHRWRWVHFLIRDLDGAPERRAVLLFLLTKQGAVADERPTKPRETTQAVRGFISGGGRIMLTPDGQIVCGADNALLLAPGVPGREHRTSAFREFAEVRRRYRADGQIARVVKTLGRATTNGWRVLEARS